MTPLICELQKSLAQSGDGPVFVHSDLLGALRAIEPCTARNEMLKRHLTALEDAAAGRDLWFPTFNFDYCRTRLYSIAKDPSQSGPLSEYARVNWARWRTQSPVFNAAGSGREPEVEIEDTILAFGDRSVFAQLVRRSGLLVFYGAPLASATIIHHAEHVARGPFYRYDKHFAGIVTGAGKVKRVTLIYHVRPKGHHLDYDWPRIEYDFAKAGLMQLFKTGTSIIRVLEAANSLRFLVGRLRGDPLYLLDSESRAWVEPALQRLGRRFVIEDFEQEQQ